MAYIVYVSSETLLLWKLQKFWEKREKLLWILAGVEHHLRFILLVILNFSRWNILTHIHTHTPPFFIIKCTLQLPSMQDLIKNCTNCFNSHATFSSYLFSSASLTSSSVFHFCTWLATLWSLSIFFWVCFLWCFLSLLYER